VSTLSAVLGLNEAHILSIIADGDERSLSDIIDALECLKLDRTIREATAYMALQRMSTRGFVVIRKIRITSQDGRVREIGVYHITAGGRSAVQQFSREVSSIGSRLIPVNAGV